jgi:hypothetical protein
MTDFFSLTLSTIQVLCFLKEWVSGYVNQRKSVEDLYGEIDGILVVLNRLKDLPNSDRENSSVLEIPLRQCRRKCEELKNSLRNAQRTRMETGEACMTL